MGKKQETSFEENIASLEAIVEKMESGDVTLQELMQNYSRGVELAKRCRNDLDRAEKTIDILIRESADEEYEELPLHLDE